MVKKQGPTKTNNEKDDREAKTPAVAREYAPVA